MSLCLTRRRSLWRAENFHYILRSTMRVPSRLSLSHKLGWIFLQILYFLHAHDFWEVQNFAYWNAFVNVNFCNCFCVYIREECEKKNQISGVNECQWMSTYPRHFWSIGTETSRHCPTPRHKPRKTWQSPIGSSKYLFLHPYSQHCPQCQPVDFYPLLV